MMKPWELTTATTCYVAGGFVAVQCQSYSSDGQLGYSGSHHPYGFRGRPQDADPQNGGGAVLMGFEGDRGHAWLLEDARILPLLPDEGSGGSIQYGVSAANKVSYVMISGADGSMTLQVDDSSGPINIAHGGAGGSSIAVSQDHVDVGGPGGAGAMFDDGSFAAWVQAISAFCHVAAPPLFTSTRVRVKKT